MISYIQIIVNIQYCTVCTVYHSAQPWFAPMAAQDFDQALIIDDSDEVSILLMTLMILLVDDPHTYPHMSTSVLVKSAKS